MKRIPYSYTILRYHHNIATGEFANVGLVLLAEDGFAGTRLSARYRRLSGMFSDFDGKHYRSVVTGLQRALDAEIANLRQPELIGDVKTALDIAHRVLPHDDSAFQWSPLGTGLSRDPAVTVERLYQDLVACNEPVDDVRSRSDEDVARIYSGAFEATGVLQRLERKVLQAEDDEVTFPQAWKNHQWHCMDPVSFDLVRPESIRNKAHNRLGALTSIEDVARREDCTVHFLIGAPESATCKRAYEKALNVLHRTRVPHEFVHEHEAADFAATVARDMAEHEARG